MIFFRRQNLIGKLTLKSFCCAACFFFCLSVGKAQTKNNLARSESSRSMLSEAQSALASEDFSRAAVLLEKILSGEPRNSAAHTLAGIAADRQNNLTSAEKHFAAAAKLAPVEPETRNNYGAILLRLNKRTEAAREFAASLKVNPNQRSALVNLAQIRFAENDRSTPNRTVFWNWRESSADFARI